MVSTRRTNFASDDEAVYVPRSRLGGSNPNKRGARVQELKTAIEHLSPRKPGTRIFDMLDEEAPGGRRESWEGPTTSAKPAEEVFEAEGTLEHEYQLPSIELLPQRTYTTPRIDCGTRRRAGGWESQSWQCVCPRARRCTSVDREPGRR